MNSTFASLQSNAYNLAQKLLSYLFSFNRKNPKLSLFGMILVAYWSLRRIHHMLKQPKSLRNRVVLITGGVSGIGRLVALLCKLKGSKVIVWDVNDHGLREMEELVDVCMKVDITSTVQVENAGKLVLDKYEYIDILVNNAGIVTGKPLLQLKKKQIQKCFEVNTLSHFWTVQQFLPCMISRKSGHIVTISSCAAIQGVPQLVDYSASKAACRAFHDTLSLELAQQGCKDGIALTCINPYFVNTGMFHGTTTTTWWILRKVGFDFLEPEFVATEIVRAIEYEAHEVFIPDIMRIGWLMRYAVMPDWMTTYLITNSGCNIHTQ